MFKDKHQRPAEETWVPILSGATEEVARRVRPPKRSLLVLLGGAISVVCAVIAAGALFAWIFARLLDAFIRSWSF